MDYTNTKDFLDKINALCDSTVNVVFESEKIEIFQLSDAISTLKLCIEFYENVLENSYIYKVIRNLGSKTFCLQDPVDNLIIRKFHCCEFVDLLISSNKIMINITQGFNNDFEEYSLTVNSLIKSITVY